MLKTTTSVADANLIPTWESLDEFSNVATEYGTALSDYSCFEKEILAPINLPVGKSVLDVFGACFDDGSTVLVRYHEERKDTDNVLENWRPTTDGKSFRGQRQFTCTTPIKAMMGKMYPYVEYQRYALFKVNGTPHLVIQFSSQVSGVMFGDSFRAEALVVFTQTGSDETAVVSMRAYGHVQFLRSVWIKGKILSTSLSELPECYTRLAAIIQRELAGKENSIASPTAAAAPPSVVESSPPSGASSLEEDLPQTAEETRWMVRATMATSAAVLLVNLRGLYYAATASASAGEKGQHNVLLGGASGTAVIQCIRPALVSFYLMVCIVFVWVTSKTLSILLL